MKDEFRFFKLGLGSRLVLSGGLFAAGVALQLALRWGLLPGLALIVAGWFPLMLRVATNKPEDQGLEEWRPVTMAEIDRIEDGIRQSVKLKRKTRSLGTGVLVGFLAPFALFSLIVLAAVGRGDLSLVICDAFAFLVPALFFGRVRVFVPGEIQFKLLSFRAFLSESLPEGVAVAPYLRFDKDKAGRDIPEDLRLMLERKRPPADLVGVQVQAAVNKGPNGNVPYLYAVVLTKGTGGSAYAAARSYKRRGYKVDAGADGEYGTVVIRQDTDSGGYHTTPDDCRELKDACVAVLGSMGV
jgi:hypothetical protein